MDIRVETTDWTKAAADWLIVPIWQESDLPAGTSGVDGGLGGAISRLRERGDVTGKLAETCVLPVTAGIAAERVLLLGLGKPAELTVAKLEKALMTAVRQTSDKANRSVAIGFDAGASSLRPAQFVQTAAVAAVAGSTGQDLYKQEPGRFAFSTVALLIGTQDKSPELERSAARGQILGDAMNLARELVNRSAEDIYPESFATRAQQAAADCGLKCEILDEKQLAAEKMNSLLAVARGSDRPPRVVVLEHRGGPAGSPTLAIVGKGVTFDSGGLSIKPSDGMLTMKCDMAGAATMLGAMTAIARLKLPVNVVGYAGLVENMINGRSYKLGDILTARNGVTIEVQNTDAEGRLVINDVLALAADRGADKLIDLATLTGACVVALGEDVVGAFSNNQAWCDTLLAAAKTCGEDVWQMPMFDHYAELLKSDIADCRNIGGRWGGAITAAKFLEKFVAGKPWVHLDIAGPSFASANKPHREGGATGTMVRTLVETAAKFS